MADYETRRFSRTEYERLIELGVFQPGEALELLGGHLVVAEPQGAAHYSAIVKAARALQAAFGPAWYVRMQGPIGRPAAKRSRSADMRADAAHRSPTRGRVVRQASSEPTCARRCGGRAHHSARAALEPDRRTPWRLPGRQRAASLAACENRD